MRLAVFLLLVHVAHPFSAMASNRRQQSTRNPDATHLQLKPVASASISSDGSTKVNTPPPAARQKTSKGIKSLADWKMPTNLPKLIVFDLDNTLWTPELYQIRQRNLPVANRDISLFEGARQILEFLQQHQETSELAIASRTNKASWANQLLNDFTLANGVPLSKLFSSGKTQILTGSKRQHFENLKQATGYSYQEMVFFDDDMRLNLKEISQMGILCGYCPKGMTVELFQKTLERYSDLKSDEGWLGEIVSTHKQASAGEVLQGFVDFYNPTKRFGFIKDLEAGESFFFHESKVPADMTVQKGMKVSFEATQDNQGRPAAVILGPSDEKTMPCFTMSQPFAALLLNGLKTVESRNNDMFASLAPGTKVLLQVGRKDWHDTTSWKSFITDQKDQSLALLPQGCKKGQVVGIVTVGKTWLSTEQERSSSQLQRQVLAPSKGIGKYCTEILEAKWLPKGMPQRGNPGIYQVRVGEDFDTN